VLADAGEKIMQIDLRLKALEPEARMMVSKVAALAAGFGFRRTTNSSCPGLSA